jgi:hypothetical protein
MNKFRFLPLASSVSLVLTASAANAVPIIGSISFSDGFGSLPEPPTSAIVSDKTTFDVQPEAQVFTATGDLAGTTSPATAFDFDVNSLPTPFFSTSNGFSFLLTNAAIGARVPLVCANNLCTDSIRLEVSGNVSGSGFDPTEFLGTWTGNGSCIGVAGTGTCSSDVSATWSASLTVTGEEVPPPVTIPEPASIALLGLGLAGMAAVRRRISI